MATTNEPTGEGGPARPAHGHDGSPAHARDGPAPARPAPHVRPAPALVRVARVAAATAVTGLAALLVWWWATGGTWEIVSTPSMGRAAPVGTLLWVKPTEIDDIRVGDVVTFHTPPIGTGTGGKT